MRLLFPNHIQNAMQSLRSTKLRTLLTMVGVAIGVASITIILSLSTGATKMVQSQIDSLGGAIAVVRPGSNQPIQSITDFSQRPGYGTSTLTEKDLASINKIQHVTAAPLMTINGSVKSTDSTAKDATVIATTPDLTKTTNLTVETGQFIDATTDDQTAVVGAQLSVDLFGTEQSIGQIFTIRGEPFRVIGILKRLNNPVNFNQVDFDRAAIINFNAGKNFNQGVANIQQIDISVDNHSQFKNVLSQTNAALRKNHDGEQDFAVLSGDEIVQPTSELFYTIAGATAAIAAISLIVGGIGIMNIMLVSVAERTREIGLRKALGASNSDISWQFLIESVAISIGGGIAGYLIGYIVSFAISLGLTFDPAITWQIAAVAIGISIVVGSVFGLYPAMRAAHKDPIESLRQYN